MNLAKSRSNAGWRFSSGWISFAILLFDLSVGWTQQNGRAVYFASEEIRLARVLERKEILNYRVVLLGERRYRETYFDSTDLSLYHQRMFYRVKESFDGHTRIEFYGGASKDRPSLGSLHSVALPASTALAAREGRLNDPILFNSLPLPGGRDFKNIQLAVEYSRHSVALERLDKQEVFVSLLVGSFVGFSGKKVQ